MAFVAHAFSHHFSCLKASTSPLFYDGMDDLVASGFGDRYDHPTEKLGPSFEKSFQILGGGFIDFLTFHRTNLEKMTRF